MAFFPSSWRVWAGPLVRWGYLPLLLLGGNGLAIFLASAGVAPGWFLLLQGGAIVVSLLAERVLPYRADWNQPKGDGLRDVLHAFGNEALNMGTLAAMPLISAALPLHDRWPRSWPFVLQVLLAIFVLDAGITLTHWASHRILFLWRFHAVHHSIQRFYGFNGLMKHPLHRLLEASVGAFPLLIAGLPEEVAHAISVAVSLQLLLQHSNVDYAVGPLRHVLSLNEGHRFHHLKWQQVGDVNFGLFTLLWDHLLGTACVDPSVRFDSGMLGIARWPVYPVHYTGQLLAPFRAQEEANVSLPDGWRQSGGITSQSD
jgi:sterol desaturase/sphingolipid hydroxylase (fatty acid hydroxylase superfamily)